MEHKPRSNRPRRTDSPDTQGIVAAVSGGPDSRFLLEKLMLGKRRGLVLGHVNFGARGPESDKDQKLVEELARKFRLDVRIQRSKLSGRAPGFEERAREIRRIFLKRLAEESGGALVATGHTADDQVETILMRFFEGAGISGLKGIPRRTKDGTVRPILGFWKEDIVAFLENEGIPYRLDRSNADTRFERNWIRHVLLPLLEERYGRSVKKRIFTLGERFRELDDYLETEAARWIRRNVAGIGSSGAVSFRRTPYSGLPTALRVKVLQRLFFDHLGVCPNERLLQGVDRSVRSGGPSAERALSGGWKLVNRYREARFVRATKEAAPAPGMLRTETAGKVTPAGAKRIAAGGDAEVFDAAGLLLPVSVRPLRRGDRIRPFGMRAEKKVKEILIDRKVPRGERWGRAAVCDAEGEILWVPGVVRSAHAPVTRSTRCVKIIRYLP